jgi:WD40 repeat protein/DNA-binding SARP family transcriptional activator
MKVGVLGPLTLDGATAAAGPRDRVVAAALVAGRGRAVSAEQLSDALWTGSPPPTWNKVLQGCVARLRKVLGRAAIETTEHGYRLDLPPDEVDAWRFERDVGRVVELLTLDEPHRAAYVADETLALWRGRPLADLADWDAGRIEAERLEELHRDLEELRLDALLEAGRWREVLTDAPVRVAEAPLRERRWALLALAQYRAGRQGEALATLRRAATTLTEGLGIDPGDELRSLEAAILRHDPELTLPVTLPDASPVCPYLGLLSYEPEDADRYFGRQADLATCLDQLAGTGVLAVVGPSGCGKSSFVRAGIVAALRREGRTVVVVTPGTRPMDALTALPTDGPSPVLVVDQCEEAVTLCEDTLERTRFFDALAAHAERSPLIVALRADRIGDVSAHPAFAVILQRGLHLLTPMGIEDLRAVITGPARQAGLLLEGGLVELVLRDVEDEPGALPLLSHALRQTWLAREGRTLTVAGYHASGGIRGAVGHTAEEVYANAPPHQRDVMRDLLLRLVVPSTDGAPSRAPVPRRTVSMDDDHERVVELLVRARLVTSDEDTVELAHEALTVAWPRLRTWLDEDVEGQRIRRHLSVTADAWDGMGRPETELYRGPRLAAALTWRDDAAPDLTSVEHDFLDESTAQVLAEEHAARRRRRTLVGVLAGAAAIAVVFGSIAAVQARTAANERDSALVAEQRAEEEAGRAEREAERAAEAATVARARELTAAGVAALDRDPALAKLLALSAFELDATATLETTALLHRALALDRVVARVAWEPDDLEPWWIQVHPDGERMLVLAHDRVAMLSIVDQVEHWRWPPEPLPPGAEIDYSWISADGEQVLVGVLRDIYVDEVPPSDVPGVHVLDVETGDALERIDIGPCGGWVEGLAGSRLVVNRANNDECNIRERLAAAVVVDLDSREEQVLSESMHHWSPISPDGSTVALSESREASLVIVLIDLDTGDRREIDLADHDFSEGDGDPHLVRAFSPDGRWLLSGTRRMIVWDVATGTPRSTFAGHGGESNGNAFSTDGSRVITTGRDAGVWIWDARTGDVVATFPAVGSGSVSVADDGRVLVTDAPAGRLILLDPDGASELWRTAGCGDRGALGSTLNAAGTTLAVAEFCGEDDMTTYVMDSLSGETVLALEGHGSQALRLSPDGTRFVRQEREFDEGVAHITAPRIRDARTGELLLELDGACRYPAINPTGTPDFGCALYPDLPAPLWAWRLKWSPDGALIAAARGGAGGFGLMVWDATSGELLHHHDDCNVGDTWFSTDSSLLVVACGYREDPMLVALSTDDWEEVRVSSLDPTVDGLGALDLADISADGSVLLASGQPRGEESTGSVHWFDATTLELVHSVERAHEGSTKAIALSPDRRLLATGASDGSVKVWDTSTRRQVHEVSMGDTQVQGLAFVRDRHLAVATERSGLEVVTVDDAELVDLVRRSLQRGFTAAECTRYGFDDACPTLEELSGRRS